MQRASSWLRAQNAPSNYQPQPVITNVISLSPRRNQTIPKTHYTARQNVSSYRSPFTYQISQPIITRVESLSPLKNLHKSISNGSVSISSKKCEPECIVLDDDDGNISLNSIPSICSSDLNDLKLKDFKTEETDILKIDCENSLSKVSCEINNLVEENVEGKHIFIESCEGAVSGGTSHNNDSSDTTDSTMTRKRVSTDDVLRFGFHLAF